MKTAFPEIAIVYRAALAQIKYIPCAVTSLYIVVNKWKLHEKFYSADKP